MRQTTRRSEPKDSVEPIQQVNWRGNGVCQEMHPCSNTPDDTVTPRHVEQRKAWWSQQLPSKHVKLLVPGGWFFELGKAGVRSPVLY
jgi:hypothetical protein